MRRESRDASEATLAVHDAAFSPAERMRNLLERHVDSGYVPGLVAGVWHGENLHVEVLGRMAFDGPGMQRDSIFRIASLTKPVTAVAALCLVEEGLLRLDDPVDPLLPELADRRVLTSLGAQLDDTVAAVRPITLRDLLTQRFGLGSILVFPPRHPIQHAMAEAGVAPGMEPYPSPDEFMQRLGGLPLAYQPGSEWLYHTGLDVAGVLIARAADDRLGDVLNDRIFDPLGMQDTGFHVPRAKRERTTTAYARDPATGALVPCDRPDGTHARPPAFEAGGSGLVSTMDDYLTFCRMLLGRGSLDGVRVLSPASVELMTTDQLTDAQRRGDHAAFFFQEDSGWGLGVSVTIRRRNLWSTPGRFGWNGVYGTSAYVDPAERLIGVLMMQRRMDIPAPPPPITDFWTAVYQWPTK